MLKVPKNNYAFIALLVFSFLFAGCVITAEKDFKAKIKKKSDDYLLSYYYGINERLKGINNHGVQNAGEFHPDKRRPIHTPMNFGSATYDLEKKKINIKRTDETRYLAINFVKTVKGISKFTEIK